MTPGRWLWIGVATVPPAVGVAVGIVSITKNCDWGIHGVDVFLAELLLVPLVAGWGLLAGAASLRPRGRVPAVLGGLVGGLAGLVWTALALYGTEATLVELGC